MTLCALTSYSLRPERRSSLDDMMTSTTAVESIYEYRKNLVRRTRLPERLVRAFALSFSRCHFIRSHSLSMMCHHVSLLQYSYYTKYTHGRRKCVFVLVSMCESAECSFVCVLARARSTTTTVNVQKVKWNDYVWATLIVSDFGEINKLMTCTLATSWGMCIPMYRVIILHIII